MLSWPPETTPALGTGRAGRRPAVGAGDAAVVGVAEPGDGGHDGEAELGRGQGEVGFGLGPVGPEEAGTLGIGAASDGEGQSEDALEGGDGAEVVVVGPGAVLAFGAVEGDRFQGQGAVRLRSWSSSFTHGSLL